MPVDCPQCGITSTFPTRKRLRDGVLQVFISCRHCPYELVMREGPREVVELELDLEHLHGLASAGVPVDDVIERRMARLREVRERYGV